MMEMMENVIHDDTVTYMEKIAKENIISEEDLNILLKTGYTPEMFSFEIYEYKISYVNVHMEGNLKHCISIHTSKSMCESLSRDIGYLMDIFKFKREGKGKSFWTQVAGKYLFTFIEDIN